VVTDLRFIKPVSLWRVILRPYETFDVCRSVGDTRGTTDVVCLIFGTGRAQCNRQNSIVLTWRRCETLRLCSVCLT